MSFGSIKPDNAKKDPELSADEDGQPQGLDKQIQSGLSSASSISEASASAVGAALAPGAPALNPECVLQAMSDAEVGIESGLADDGINCLGLSAEPVKIGNVAPEFREWVEPAEGAGNEEGLAEEDWQIGLNWLEATHALIASVENWQSNPYQ